MMRLLTQSVWFCVKPSRRYGELSVRMTQKTPTLKPGEVAIKVHLEVPNTLFSTPSISAKIRLPEGVESHELDLEVAEEAIRSATGVQVEVFAPDDDED